MINEPSLSRLGLPPVNVTPGVLGPRRRGVVRIRIGNEKGIRYGELVGRSGDVVDTARASAVERDGDGIGVVYGGCRCEGEGDRGGCLGRKIVAGVDEAEAGAWSLVEVPSCGAAAACCSCTSSSGQSTFSSDAATAGAHCAKNFRASPPYTLDCRTA